MTKSLIETLIQKNIITKDIIDDAVLISKRDNTRLTQTLVSYKFIDEETLAKETAAFMGLAFVELGGMQIKPEVLTALPYKVIEKFNAVPYKIIDGTLFIATADPADFNAVSNIETAAGREVVFAAGPRRTFLARLRSITRKTKRAWLY